MLEGFESMPLWRGGVDGYHTYRIPALVVTCDRTLLAFCEGRRHSGSDHGDIDLLLKRSTDGGHSWSTQRMVYAEAGEITIGNPAPVVDFDTGAVWMPFTRDNRDVLLTHSVDDGVTWSDPVDMTTSVKLPDWSWYATGPGNGIQLHGDAHRGRLVIPCDHRLTQCQDRPEGARSHVIWSDDRGESWQVGQATDRMMNECAVVELGDGRLMLNMRSYRKKGCRAAAFSDDGGATWSACVDRPDLPDPTCQGSLVRHGRPGESEGDPLLFCNLAMGVETGRRHGERVRLTVRLSEDDGRTWPIARVLHEGPSAYSCLASLPNWQIGVLYEAGVQEPYETILFARFSLDWLTGDAED